MEKSIKVGLFGTCNGSTWREELIPLLEKNNIDYFNPVVDVWDDEARRKEEYEKDNCDFCLFVITSKMEGVFLKLFYLFLFRIFKYFMFSWTFILNL